MPSKNLTTVLPFIVQASVASLLCLTFLQDMRERAISLILFPLLFMSFLLTTVLHVPFQEVSVAFLLNLAFLILQAGLLYGYFWLKQGSVMPVIGSMLGWGDVLFWVTTTVLFSPANFILFFLLSSLFSLSTYLLLRTFMQGKQRAQVPLAGLQALFLLFLLVIQWFFPAFSLHDDYLILNHLI